MEIVGSEQTQIPDVNTYQQERQTKGIVITLFPFGNVCREYSAEFVGRKTSFRCFYGCNTQATERVCSRNLVVDCIVKDGANVPQMDIACIDRRRRIGTPTEEPLQPRFRNVLKSCV